jgi:hypothetical protein
MNGIADGVRQLPGTSVNQVPDVERVLVTAGTGVPTSGLILGCVIGASATNPEVTRSSIDVCCHTSEDISRCRPVLHAKRSSSCYRNIERV